MKNQFSVGYSKKKQSSLLFILWVKKHFYCNAVCLQIGYELSFSKGWDCRVHKRLTQLTRSGKWLRYMISYIMCFCAFPLFIIAQTQRAHHRKLDSLSPVLEETLMTRPNTQRAHWFTKSLFYALEELGNTSPRWLSVYFNKAFLSSEAGPCIVKSRFR